MLYVLISLLKKYHHQCREYKKKNILLRQIIESLNFLQIKSKIYIFKTSSTKKKIKENLFKLNGQNKILMEKY